MPKVLVPLADGCEELEAVTVIDLLRRAGIEVVTAGLKPGIVKASRGVQLVPDITLDVALQDDYDMVVLPGGMPGASHLKDDVRILELLKKMEAAGKYTAAICAAPMVLAEAGLLEGKRVTSYPGALDAFSGLILGDKAVEHDGKVLTSRGPGTAMDFALALVETLAGAGKRQQVETALVRS
jgi:4-methyl-5(b-hydroxyethyl)-thiazole monophosphate biosynthesis